MSPFRRFAVGAAAAVVLVMTSVVPASAHDDLLSSTPSAGERLDVSPSSVSLEFSAELMDVGALIMVADADGRDWTAASFLSSVVGDDDTRERIFRRAFTYDDTPLLS